MNEVRSKNNYHHLSIHEYMPSNMGAGPTGPQPEKIAGPMAKMRASGPRARSKVRAADNT